jgi:hypothetical protein
VESSEKAGMLIAKKENTHRKRNIVDATLLLINDIDIPSFLIVLICFERNQQLTKYLNLYLIK